MLFENEEKKAHPSISTNNMLMWVGRTKYQRNKSTSIGVTVDYYEYHVRIPSHNYFKNWKILNIVQHLVTIPNIIACKMCSIYRHQMLLLYLTGLLAKLIKQLFNLGPISLFWVHVILDANIKYAKISSTWKTYLSWRMW